MAHKMVIRLLQKWDKRVEAPPVEVHRPWLRLR